MSEQAGTTTRPRIGTDCGPDQQPTYRIFASTGMSFRGPPGRVTTNHVARCVTQQIAGCSAAFVAESDSSLRKEREMENDRLSTYLRARLRAMTYKGDDGLDDEAVHPKALPEHRPAEHQQQRHSELPPKKGDRVEGSGPSG